MNSGINIYSQVIFKNLIHVTFITRADFLPRCCYQGSKQRGENETSITLDKIKLLWVENLLEKF